ncbi:calcium-binding protein [Sinirhodobacter huangdaonensis]|uniref:Calcium-binding protein n=1 Tax=Paenirhodobacter huangdaonensis TaxID=2501515 RepID=A0A443M0C4_9RHOB|nr:calcium-binding protein [Sinirhodobacter huangdaonensis]RWR54929.1 calcium-binding protein [Sinirhodobacter huangdaonensis]
MDMLWLFALLPLGLAGAAFSGFGDDDDNTHDDASEEHSGQRLTGTSGPDLLTGGDGNDTIMGGGGNDRGVSELDSIIDGVTSLDDMTGALHDAGVFGLDGGAGDDSLNGGTGGDALIGGAGNDTLAGNVGDDLLADDSGQDTLLGGSGDDGLIALDTMAGAADLLDGGAGDDLMLGDDGDTMTGGDGEDGFGIVWSPGDAPVTITDFTRDDMVEVVVDGFDPERDSFLMDSLEGGVGLYVNDALVGTLEGTTLDDLHSNDSIFLTDSATGDQYGAEAATKAPDTPDETAPGEETTDPADPIGQHLTGTSGPDMLTGGDGNDTIMGGGGNDRGVSELDSIIDGVTSLDDMTGALHEAGVFGLDGGAGDDSLNGGVGSDALIGGAGNDTLAGNVGDDLLADDSGQDTLLGGSGDDWLIALDTVAGAADLLDGGAGDDLLFGDDGDTMTGGDGEDGFGIVWAPGDAPVTITDFTHHDMIEVMVDGFDPAQDSFLMGSLEGGGVGLYVNDALVGTLEGTTLDELHDSDAIFLTDSATGYQYGVADLAQTANGADASLAARSPDTAGHVILGTNGADALEAGNAGDTLSGFAGPDTLTGGAGDDRLSGGNGFDLLTGNDGDDTLSGEMGNDTLSGGAGQDSLSGGSGDDVLAGEAGNDTLVGWDGNDALAGGTGNDALDGSHGADTLSGGEGDDTLLGGGEADSLSGDDGNDRLSGGDGSDTLSGGTGDDTLFGNAGNDRIASNRYHQWNSDGLGSQWQLDLAIKYDDVFGLRGGEGNDSLDGGTGDDALMGEAGNDTLAGNVGNDLLFDNLGENTLLGGSGNDTLVSNDNEGGQPDLLDGGRGSDFLMGDDGDTMTGGDDGRQDTFQILWEPGDTPVTITDFAGRDRVVILYENFDHDAGSFWMERSGESDVTLMIDGEPAATLSNVDLDALDGTTAILVENSWHRAIPPSLSPDVLRGEYIVGREGWDQLWSRSMRGDTLVGLGGDDALTSHAGSDLLLGGTGEDTLTGNGGADTLEGAWGNDVLDGGDGDDLLLGGDGFDTLLGGAGNDNLSGNGWSDSLDGGAGDDTLYGKSGDDTLTDSEGRNLLVGNWGDDTLSALDDVSGAPDTLIGGDDRDVMIGDDGDVMSSGSRLNGVAVHDGADDLFIVDWNEGDAPVEIQLFSWSDGSRYAEQDEIRISVPNFDPAQDSFQMDSIEGGVGLFVNDALVARLAGCTLDTLRDCNTIVVADETSGSSYGIEVAA